MPKATKTKKSKKNKQVKNKNKQLKKDTDTKKEDNTDKHPGYSCLYLGDKELKGYGFKTGDGLLDVAPFKTLKKLDIIEEIKFKGKMCAFQPFHSLIEKYENDDILFIWDPDEQKEKECNFYFCHTIQTFEIEKKRLGISDDGIIMDPEEIKRKKEEQEEQRRKLEIEEELKREQLRIAEAIKKLKKPLIARPWKDLGSFDEIMNNKVKPTKVRNKIIISRKRKYFGLNYEFHDFDNNQNGMNVEIKSLKNGSTKYGFDVYRKLVDQNHQIGNPMIHKKTQTNWNRKINKIVQYEFNEESIKKHKDIATSTQTDDITDIADIIGFDDDLKSMEITVDDDKENNDNNQEEDDMNERLEQFLEDIYPEIHEMLTDNNLVNIFEDDFNVFKINDNDNNLGIDTKTENIKEIQTFVDLNWSRGKKISDIQWMPSSTNDNNNMIAVSCIENMSFDDRVNIMNRSRKSTILLWNLSHILLKAQTILTAPTDIFVFRFHPKNKNIIIGGLETGQVAIWDLTDYNNKSNTKTQTKSVKNQNQDTNINDDEDNIEDINVDDPFKMFDNDDDNEEDKIPIIEPKMISFIEKSHTKSVSDLLWLPEDIMIDSKTGELKYIDIKNRARTNKMINEEQFMSISGDGTILFWDIQSPKQTEKEKKKNEPAKWIPIYSKKIERKALKDNIFLDKESMDLAKYDPNSSMIAENENENENDEKTEEIGNDSGSPSEIIFGSKFCYSPLCGKLAIGTELGEYCLYNFSKINKEFLQERGSLLSRKENDKTTTIYLLDNKKDNDESLKNSIIECNNIYKQHFNDIKSIQISPHFSDIYLSIGDWRFCIWRNDKLLFISPYSSSYITDGCWSPSRPAVIITAKYDGTIDIWDLLDQTHCAVFKNSPISSTSISSIIYDKSNNKNNNILAVGDNDGNLRILQIPRNFVIPLNNEKLIMAQFYEKEYQRIKFINKRYNIHKLKTIEIEKEEELKEKNKDNEEKEEKLNNKVDQKQIDDRKLEEKYQNMLVSFRKQLGITK